MPRINYTVEQAMSTLRETDVALSKGQPVVQIQESRSEGHASPQALLPDSKVKPYVMCCRVRPQRVSF